jgi:hypothetical protein
MFNFLDSTKPVLITLPFALYWGITLSLSILFAIGLNILNHPEIICKYIDRIPLKGLKERLRKGRLYRICLERSDYLKRSNSLDVKSSQNTNGPVTTVKQKRSSWSNNGGTNDQNRNCEIGKSSSMGSPQSGQKSVVWWFRRDRRVDEEMS